MAQQPRNWNIILDVDGTLVQDVPSHTEKPKPRPFLEEFLDYVFSHFDHVAIWSAAGEEWIGPILADVFPAKHQSKDCRGQFHFVWLGDKTTHSQKWRLGGDYTTSVTKKLTKVYKAFQEYNEHNTLILDDTPHTYKYNYGNAVSIPTWYGDQDDKELQSIVKKLEEWKVLYDEQGTVRHINKF